MDVMQQLGALPLASRLRRLYERLARDGTRIYHEQKLGFEPRWFPVYYLLLHRPHMAVTEIAQEVGLSHPAVIQAAGAMEKAGLLVSHHDRKDERKRLLSLSQEGKRLGAKLTPVWSDFEQATIELMKETGVDIVDALNRIEQALDKSELHERITVRIKRRQSASIEILDYSRQHLRYFRKFNREWLQQFFTVEPADKMILNDPEGQIINNGGHIFLAAIDGRIVGTAALIRLNETTAELSMLAVTEKAQRRQAGRRLVEAAIGRAISLGFKELIHHSHPKLAAAANLCRQLGFKPESSVPRPRTGYKRKSIVIKLNIAEPISSKERNSL